MSDDVFYVAVDEYSSECHQGTPWAWLDWSEVYTNGAGLKVSNGNAPKGWGGDCLYRVRCLAAPADNWHTHGEIEDGELYVPPVTVLNRREVIAVEPVSEEDVPEREQYPYSPEFPHTKWYWKITLGAPPEEG